MLGNIYVTNLKLNTNLKKFNKPKMKFNEFLKQEIAKKGISIAEFAKLIGKKYQHVHMLVNKDVKPHIKTVHSIAKALDKDVEVLIRDFF